MMDSDEIDHKSKIQKMHVNNEVGKDDLLQTVVAEIVTDIVDLVCKRCMSFDYFFDRFNVVDAANFRRNNYELSENSFTIQSSSDSSDDEFDRILKNTQRLTSLQQEDDNDIEVAISMKTNAKLIEHEYDTMPAIEELRIHVEEDILLEKFGRIVNIVDRLGNKEISGDVVIEADSNIALDFDTIIFDSERNAVGRVFDVFGPVARPMYAILFNDIMEANEWKMGSSMYYAPMASQFTHTIFTEKLKQEKATDGCWDGDGECPDDMLAFSDDETEQRYKVKHRSSKISDERLHMLDSPRSKKARYLLKRGQSNCRRYNITRQFRNGLEHNQYDASAMSRSFNQNSMQQSSFWSAGVNEIGLRQFQPGLCLTSSAMSECPSHSFSERNMDLRQQPFFHSLTKDEKNAMGGYVYLDR